MRLASITLGPGAQSRPLRFTVTLPSSSRATWIEVVVCAPGWRVAKEIPPAHDVASCGDEILTASPAKPAHASTWTTACTSDWPVSTSGLGLTDTEMPH